MADRTGIEWTDATWNPVRGCSRVSEGCRHCYAERVAARFSDAGMAYHGYADRGRPGSKWTGKVEMVWPLIDLPLRWRRPRRIFVNSMSDLFHEALPAEEIATIFAVMVAAVHLLGHTFQVLTKRPERMRAILTDPAFWDQVNAEAGALVMERTDPHNRRSDDARATLGEYGPAHPPPGIWLGTSVEDQAAANERIPHLRATPAALRFLSCEPLLDAVDLQSIDVDGHHEVDALCPATAREVWARNWSPEATGMALDACIRDFIFEGGRYPPDDMRPRGIDWVIAGGENGPGARPMHPDWARSLRDQCAAAGVPFFFKQWGEWHPEALAFRNGFEADRWHEWTGEASPVGWPAAAIRIGKKAAGNLLDGELHQAFPA